MASKDTRLLSLTQRLKCAEVCKPRNLGEQIMSILRTHREPVKTPESKLDRILSMLEDINDRLSDVEEKLESLDPTKATEIDNLKQQAKGQTDFLQSIVMELIQNGKAAPNTSPSTSAAAPAPTVYSSLSAREKYRQERKNGLATMEEKAKIT